MYCSIVCICRYLDIAIKHALVNFHDDTETEETLLARELKATCLLNLADYNEAEQQAEHILIWAPFNGKALYIYAESLYLQCKVIRPSLLSSEAAKLSMEKHFPFAKFKLS